MNTSTNKSITSLNNPELKFLISLRKNKIRKSEKKSLADEFGTGTFGKQIDQVTVKVITSILVFSHKSK